VLNLISNRYTILYFFQFFIPMYLENVILKNAKLTLSK
jgi:hypothetical protein